MTTKIRSYFENLPSYNENPFALKDDDSVIELGLIDSYGILELVQHLEDAFSLEIDPEDMKRDNFESIISIQNFIKIKQSRSQVLAS